MKNGDILKYFFEDKDIKSVVISGCPNKDFQERYPCGTYFNGECEQCWDKFLETDDGIELDINVPKTE